MRRELTTVILGATALAMAMGCSRDSEAAPHPGATPPAVTPAAPTPPPAPVPGPGAEPKPESKNYKLTTALDGDCKAQATCVLAIKLEAAGEFHINKEYPYKFKAEAAATTPTVEFEGTDAAGKNVFSKGAGDFKIDSEKVATMRVRFKPAAKGNVTIGGTYKMSVCSAKECQLESQEVTATVTAK
jgi:hypothetical protein